jgi:hypothetical protein
MISTRRQPASRTEVLTLGARELVLEILALIDDVSMSTSQQAYRRSQSRRRWQTYSFPHVSAC